MVVARPAKPGAGQVGHLVGVRVVDRYGARFFAGGKDLIADASITLPNCRRMNLAPRLRSHADGRRGVTDDDTDGDTIADCFDQCAGLDDRIETDQNSVPDCFERIPAVSTWGVMALALLLLTAGKIAFGRHVSQAE